MDALWLVGGLLTGWGITMATLALADRRRRRSRAIHDERGLYAQALATYDTAYRLVDFLISWPRREITDRPRSALQRAPVRTATVINAATVELDTVVRRSRELAAEMRLAANTEIVPMAIGLHDALEEAILALRVESPAKLERRWSVVGPNWRSAREAFAEAAREAIGG